MVGVEARKQRGLVALPRMQQLRRRAVRILDAGAAEAGKRADRVYVLARLQPVLRVAVFVGHEGVDQPTEDAAAVRNAPLRPSLGSVPDIGGAGKNFGAARIDQALTGAVVEQ